MTPQLAGLSEQGIEEVQRVWSCFCVYILEPDLSFQTTLAAKTTKRFERKQQDR